MPKTPTTKTLHASNRVVVELQMTAPPPDKGYRILDRRGEEHGFKLEKSQQELGSAEPGGESLDQRNSESDPDDITEAMKDCRNWRKKNLFVQSGLALKRSFSNYGLRFVPAGSRGLSPTAREEFNTWRRANRGALARLAKETWDDWLLMQNAVAFWRKSGSVLRRQVLMLRPEECKFTDALGLPKLKVRLNWSESSLTGKVNKTLAARYGRGEVELKEENGEYFSVLKDDRVGWGFAWPKMHAIFRTLAQNESMEVADNLWAFLSRAVVRQFKLGHEIRQGPHAGKNTWFWNQKRSDAIRKFFEGRQGILDYTGNFDVEIEFPYPSLERFDRKKYESVLQRMALWLGPAGALFFAKVGEAPAQIKLLHAQVSEDREEVGPWLEEIVNTVLEPPVPVEVRWDNRIFKDERIYSEAMKFLLQSGPLSQRTALESVDVDQAEEQERKSEEGKLLDNEATKSKVLPVFDAAHGKTGKEPGGRPAGQTDSQPRA